MTTADEKMREEFKRLYCREFPVRGPLLTMERGFDDGWQASAAQYSTRLKELEQNYANEVAHSKQLEAGLDKAIHQNEQLQAHVSRLTDSLDKIKWHRKPGSSPTKYEYEIECMAHKALSATIQTAETYKRRVQAEALEDAAKKLEYLEEKAEKWNRHKVPELRDDSEQGIKECIHELTAMAAELRNPANHAEIKE